MSQGLETCHSFRMTLLGGGVLSLDLSVIDDMSCRSWWARGEPHKVTQSHHIRYFLEIKDNPKCSWNSKTHTFGRAPSVHQSDLFIKDYSIPTKKKNDFKRKEFVPISSTSIQKKPSSYKSWILKKKHLSVPKIFSPLFLKGIFHDNSMASSWVPVGYLLLVLAFGTVLHPELKAFYRHGHGGTLEVKMRRISELGICLHMVLVA